MPAQARAVLGRLCFHWGLRLNQHGALYRPVARDVAGVCAAWARRFLASHDSIVRVNGVVFAVGPAPHYAGLEFRFRKYEPGVERILRRLLRPGMTVVDVGAHVGYHALHAAHLVGASGTVYAFEPHPDTYRLLKMNVQLNRLSNVIAVEAAADDSCGTKHLFLGTVHEGHSTLYADALVGSRWTPVQVVTLDAYFEERLLPRLDLIKLDVQGAEIAALRGAGRILSRFPHLNLIIEFDPAFLRAAGCSPHALLDILVESEFELRRIDADGALHPVDCGQLERQTNGLEHLLAVKPHGGF